MKILQIHNEYFYRGGEETVLNAEKELLIKNGHTVFQIIRKNKKEIKNLFDIFKILRKLSYSDDSLKILEKKINKKNFPDIVHIHNTFPLWTNSTLEFFKKKKIPIVMTLHNYRLLWNYISFFDVNSSKYLYFKNSKIITFIISKLISINEKLLDNVEKFITFTKFTKKKFLVHDKLKKKLIIKPHFLQKKKIKRKKFIYKKDAIYASRISNEKGIKTLLKAWSDIDLELKIFGDGPLLKELKKGNRKNDMLSFNGHINSKSLDTQISNSKILIFPSEWYETMGMTIIQAFRAGTLVIASKIGSISNLIQHKKNGILFEPGNHIDLNRKIKWALKNPKKCDAISKNAYRDFINKYSEHKNYEILINIYKDLLRNKKNKIV